MVETDQAGFHVSGWKSVMERHSLQERAQVRPTCTNPARPYPRGDTPQKGLTSYCT